MTAAQYFYSWVSEIVGFTVSGEVKIELSPYGMCNDVLTVGGVVVAKGHKAGVWFQSAPAEICA